MAADYIPFVEACFALYSAGGGIYYVKPEIFKNKLLAIQNGIVDDFCSMLDAGDNQNTEIVVLSSKLSEVVGTFHDRIINIFEITIVLVYCFAGISLMYLYFNVFDLWCCLLLFPFLFAGFFSLIVWLVYKFKCRKIYMIAEFLYKDFNTFTKEQPPSIEKFNEDIAMHYPQIDDACEQCGIPDTEKDDVIDADDI